MHRKSASGHSFSRGGVVMAGFSRVFFQGQRKSRFFNDLPGFPGSVGHPARVSVPRNKKFRSIYHTADSNADVDVNRG